MVQKFKIGRMEEAKDRIFQKEVVEMVTPIETMIFALMKKSPSVENEAVRSLLT